MAKGKAKQQSRSEKPVQKEEGKNTIDRLEKCNVVLDSVFDVIEKQKKLQLTIDGMTADLHQLIKEMTSDYHARIKPLVENKKELERKMNHELTFEHDLDTWPDAAMNRLYGMGIVAKYKLVASVPVTAAGVDL